MSVVRSPQLYFDNPDAVEFRNLNSKERFTALQTGEVDILSRNTTWTLSRDTCKRTRSDRFC